MTAYHIYYCPDSDTITQVAYDDLSLQEAKSIFIPLVNTARLTGGQVRLFDDNLHLVACCGCYLIKDTFPREWEAEIAHLQSRMELLD